MTRDEYNMSSPDDPMLEDGARVNGKKYMDASDSEDDTCVQKCASWSKENILLLMTIGAVVLGIILGFCLRLAQPGPDAILLINFPGDLLIRMLKMLIIPLVVSSLISGLAQLNPKSCGKMGSKALLYYFTTTFIAIIIGISLVVAIHPGNPELKANAEREERDVEGAKISTLDAFLDLIRNLFPDNLLEACFRQVKTRYKDKKLPDDDDVTTVASFYNGTNITITTTTDSTIVTLPDGSNVTVPLPTSTLSPGFDMKERVLTKVDGINVLGLICFCIGFGIVLSRYGDKAPLLGQFFRELSEIVMALVNIIMWYSPIGILFLIMGNIISIPNLGTVASTLGMYMVTVCTGLIIHALIVLPLIYLAATRQNPFKFLRGVLQAWLTALGTASSSATLPVTFRCLEENNNIDKRVTRFVLPVGATVNMDGTALYEAVAAIFIAQLNGRNLAFGEICTISLTATLASIGAASIPSAGLVTMVMVLIAADLPPEDIGIIFTVDWLLDRFRTSVNVLGDAFGAGIVHHLSRDDLAKEDEEIRLAKLAAEENGDREIMSEKPHHSIDDSNM